MSPEELRLRHQADSAAMRTLQSDLAEAEHKIATLTAEKKSLVAALEYFVESDLDPEGTAAAALWNNGRPLGRWQA